MRRLPALGGAVAALTWTLLAGPVGPAVADPIGACSATTGTIVAVDFSHWGGPMVRGCGVHSTTGYRLLQDGGFTTAGDSHDGPAFVCRIGNAAFSNATQYPTPRDEACILTPPASAYWSYWLAPKGRNSWTYSQLGAMSEVPKQGGVELWQFGGTDVAGNRGRPTISPDQLRAQNGAPIGAGGGQGGGQGGATSSRHVAAPAPSGRVSVATTRAGAAESSTPAAPASSSASARAGSARRSPLRPGSSAGSSSEARRTGGAAPAATSSGRPIVDAAAAHARTTSAGSGVSLIAGLALLAALTTGAVVTVLRRRRSSAAAD